MKEHKKKQEESVEHHEHEKSDIKLKIKKKTLKKGLVVIGIIAIVVLAIVAIKNFAPSKVGERVEMDFYVMSKCPYGIQVENGIAPVLEEMGDNINFNLNFIARENADGSFTSLHGQTEVDGDIVQLCAIKYEPKKYMDMVVCMNKESGSIPQNWENCSKENGLDVEKIRNCYEGDEGKQLLSESIKKTNAIGATGSPTIYMNNGSYAGGRTEADFLRTICNAFEGERPEACADIPEPVEVHLIVLNDKRCEECDVSRLVSQLESLFPGLKVEYKDYMDKDGKELFEQANLEFLPAILFDESVEKGEGYANVQNYLEDAGKYKSLKIGASFDPTTEICDNEIDDDNDKAVDCDDSDCDGEFVCMEKMEVPQVELFVMSHCPYGTQTEKGFIPVVELLGDKIDFEVKFVSYSMHGKKEIDEETLQYCVQKEQNDKFLSYLKCFLKEGNSTECVDEVGLNEGMLNACIKATDEEFNITELYNDQSTWSGGSYPQFNTHKAENEKYGVSGSPSLAVNGVKVESFGRDPASLLKIVCLGFKDKPAECDEQLSTQTPSTGFGFETTSSTPSQGTC